MNRLLVGDLHLKPSNLEVANILFTGLENIIRERHIEDIVFLGDVYDTKAVIRSEAQNFLIKWLKSPFFVSKKTHILVGNHDYENLNCIEHALEPLKLLSNVFVHDKSEQDGQCLFVPFMPNNESFLNAFNGIQTSNMILYCHQGFYGFDYGDGFLDDHSISLSDFLPFKAIIAGHYHKFQQKDNLLYLGTPFSHSFSEVNQSKYIGIQTDSNIEFIDVAKWGVPLHKRIQYDATNDEYIEKPEKLHAWDFVDFIVKCEKEDLPKFDQDWALNKIDCQPTVFKVKHEIVDSGVSIRLEERMSVQEMYKKYLEANNLMFVYEKGLGFIKDAILQI